MFTGTTKNGSAPNVNSSPKRPAQSQPAASSVAKQPRLLQTDEPKSPMPPKQPINALDFHKSRPQVAAMDQAQAQRATRPQAVVEPKPAATQTNTSKVSETEAAASHVPSTDLTEPQLPLFHTGAAASWKQHETILEFLRRLPVADPATARVGPWLWVRCSRDLQDWTWDGDVGALEEAGEPLLDSLLKQRSIIEQQNPGKATGTITRKMGPYRDQLEIDLLNAASNAKLTCGKWMLFPKADDLPRVWRLVAKATAAGKLGPTSKVGTWEPDNLTKGTLICVYTYDFSDLVDLKRVLSAMIENDIIKQDARAYYKCDAYTHLNIMSDNPYKLRASLYFSEEIPNDKVKYKDGLIIRLKTKNGAVESFHTS